MEEIFYNEKGINYAYLYKMRFTDSRHKYLPCLQNAGYTDYKMHELQRTVFAKLSLLPDVRNSACTKRTAGTCKIFSGRNENDCHPRRRIYYG